MHIEDAIEILIRAGYKITRPRRRILEAVFRQPGSFSAGDLLAALNRRAKGSFDLVTIYRNLPVLEETGVICRADFSDAMARYMLADHGHAHHHHHVICRSCQRVEPLSECLVEAQEKALRRMGFTQISHRLEFSGLCSACA